MEEKKRLTATKAAIAKFRVDHPIFTDEYLASLVESTYPDLYLDNLEVANEIVMCSHGDRHLYPSASPHDSSSQAKL